MTRRLFTLDQANASLVLVRRIVGDIVKYYQQVLDCQEIMEASQQNGSREQLEMCQKDLINHVNRLQRCADELAGVGLELKDWALGIVDFPSLRDGREVRLCWQHGEESVHFWHSADADCGRRQEVGMVMAAV